jgi:hypothetical protein
MKQKCFEDLEEAMRLAMKWAKKESSVFIIKSNNKYYVEAPPSMIRTWEIVVAQFENGKLIKE